MVGELVELSGASVLVQGDVGDLASDDDLARLLGGSICALDSCRPLRP